MTSPATIAAPLDATARAPIVADFRRDGFVRLPGLLEPEEVAELKACIDRVFEDDQFADNRYGAYVATRLFETNPLFVKMLTREPIISLAEDILGADCHLIAQNVVRNRPGEAISSFHVDDTLFFPLPDEIPRHDPRMTMPVFIMGVQLLLTDVTEVAHGPTQFVPGSHYSGRQPNCTEWPTFEGREPVSIFGRAGDVYLQDGQCWHRGAPNTSDRTRYLFQMAFSQRFVSQRFFPFVNYRMPDHVLAGADDRLRRILGLHPKGPYG